MISRSLRQITSHLPATKIRSFRAEIQGFFVNAIVNAGEGLRKRDYPVLLPILKVRMGGKPRQHWRPSFFITDSVPVSFRVFTGLLPLCYRSFTGLLPVISGGCFCFRGIINFLPTVQACAMYVQVCAACVHTCATCVQACATCMQCSAACV